jgi:hypothetical protein
VLHLISRDENQITPSLLTHFYPEWLAQPYDATLSTRQPLFETRKSINFNVGLNNIKRPM